MWQSVHHTFSIKNLSDMLYRRIRENIYNAHPFLSNQNHCKRRELQQRASFFLSPCALFLICFTHVPVLSSLFPFCPLRSYSSACELPPHIYALAQSAFNALKDDHVNQAVIISLSTYKEWKSTKMGNQRKIDRQITKDMSRPQHLWQQHPSHLFSFRVSYLIQMVSEIDLLIPSFFLSGSSFLISSFLVELEFFSLVTVIPHMFFIMWQWLFGLLVTSLFVRLSVSLALFVHFFLSFFVLWWPIGEWQDGSHEASSSIIADRVRCVCVRVIVLFVFACFLVCMFPLLLACLLF